MNIGGQVNAYGAELLARLVANEVGRRWGCDQVEVHQDCQAVVKFDIAKESGMNVRNRMKRP